MAIASGVIVDADALRAEVKSKYREVATDPHAEFHFHTGRYLAEHLGYDDEFVGSVPDVAVESFAGVANPFSLHPLSEGEHVVDIGSCAGFDAFVAAYQVGPSGKVVGIDTVKIIQRQGRKVTAFRGR